MPLPSDGLRAVNVYAVSTATDLTLIDGGWALDAARRQLERSLSELGREVGDIARFLVTHVHRDHYTQAVAVRREFGTDVHLGEGERPSLELLHSRRGRGLATQLRRMETAGAAPLATALRARARDRRVNLVDWELPDVWIADGETVDAGGRPLQAIRTPGHTQGHLVFADDATGVLFAGDHVLPHITPSIALEPVDAALPLGDYLTSLAAMRARPDMWLLPAHGPVTTSVHARVDELLVHHEQRLDATGAAVAAGAATGYDTARVLRWTRRGTAFHELDQFNQILAVSETLAHLDLLVARGRLERSCTDGVQTYAAAD